MNLTRLESLIGEENILKLKKLKVLVLGLGGVGGYVVESLVRSGVENITLVDGDTIKPSNINRQIIVTKHNINKYKTREWKKRIKLINKNAIVNIINTFITLENMECLFGDDYDYIIDVCDSTKIKVKLIEKCNELNVKLISCMGTANKIDATKLSVSTLDKTDNDPLAKKIRKELKDKSIMSKITVITSSEKPVNNKVLGSTSYVPAIAGLLVTNYIINEIINN
ncbi:MAG: tRNA threonylcarbamoyladenosine dehydratase [Tenericutes bacterium]|nr:tRNA threonylcarbamoyladenosine dehydratase [Mycoplasmatota bacterium]